PTPATPLVDPDRFAAFGLDQDALAKVLEAAPAERRRAPSPAPGEGLVISIPTPAGDFQRFAIVDSPIMAQGLAAEHPEIKTYTGRGLDDDTATVRLDLTPIGFHASVRSDAGAWYVDPRYRDLSQYVAYDRDALEADPYQGFVEHEDSSEEAPTVVPRDDRAADGNGNPVTLRVYRLALVSDYNYANNTPGDTTSAKVVLMNRVDQLYEQDFAIRMDLIAGNDALNLDTVAQTTGTGGPCGTGACFTVGTLTCSSPSITRNNVVAGRIVGAGSYDIAHLVLGVSGGGIAGLGVIGGTAKGRGCTGLSNPIGDYFAVDYVAHEMGHQFGGDHSFNGTQSNCSSSNRATGATTVEPGSGSSVMAYAGICSQDDLQEHSDPYFSEASITQMSAYVNQAEGTLVPVQQAILDDFAGTDAFAITYGGQTSATITNGTNYTTPGIKAAIEGIAGWPAGATVTVSALSATGFTVSFGGTLAAGTPGALGFTALSGATGFFGRTAVAGPTTRGGTATTTGNHAPDVSVVGTGSYTIPARTPFLLDATGSDAEGDPLTYMWEQNDRGTQTVSGGTALVNNTKTNGPLFRMFGTAARYVDPNDAYETPSPGENAATATTWRSFPDVAQVLAGNTNAATGACPAAPPDPATVPDATVDCFSEFLPTSDWVGVDSTRTMHFRVTARDDHPGFGGLGTADATLTVAPSAGPFRVTSQASPATVASSSSLPVTWNVAGTTANGINVADVKISLSVDGGQTFSEVLAASTPNDGSESVTLPRVATTTGRIKIEAIGNVFYDASRANLTITTSDPVLLSGPATADLGSATVGHPGTATGITITNDGTGNASLGAVSI
ncbi:MAG TPA: M12 family metallo-peptidase, partial [Baekduia sp.]|nr:M12 family metallo-peptidase [Baekduia sp.]